MRVTINGEDYSFDQVRTLEAVLNELGIDPSKVAIERNLEIVPKTTYADVMLGDGDKLEIVHFIGGGLPDGDATVNGFDDSWEVAGHKFSSRLIVGTGKYKDFEENRDALIASGAEMVTVAVRRVNVTNPNEPMLVDYIDPKKFTYLPNTAGCFTAEDAMRTLRLAREAGGWKLVKLEVLGDQQTLYPNMPETIRAAKELVKDGFDVMVYCSDDPIAAKELEDIGCCAIMPLGSLIGSGRGIMNPINIQIIKSNAKVPVVVDAGVGCASDAAFAMELGCDAVLMNSAIAMAKDPIRMANAMKHGVIAGRESFLAGRMEKKVYAEPSSPITGLIERS